MFSVGWSRSFIFKLLKQTFTGFYESQFKGRSPALRLSYACHGESASTKVKYSSDILDLSNIELQT